MRYQLIEAGHEWIVACDGVEVARFMEQATALEEITGRLRLVKQGRASLTVQFEKPAD